MYVSLHINLGMVDPEECQATSGHLSCLLNNFVDIKSALQTLFASMKLPSH